MTTLSLKSTLLSILFIALSFSSIAQASDDRMKIRLGFTSVNDIHRQLLVTVDENATAGIDFGFDAEAFGNYDDDMYWILEDRKFLIQATNNIDADTVLSLGLHTATDGVNTILVDELINVPEALEVVIYDTETNTYHNIKDNAGFSIDLAAGIYLNRFQLRFVNNTEEETATNDDETASSDEVRLSVNETEVQDNISINFFNKTKNIVIKNPSFQTVKSVEVYNFNGQLVAQHNTINTENRTAIQANNLNAGHYIIIVNTDLGTTTKKVLVN